MGELVELAGNASTKLNKTRGQGYRNWGGGGGGVPSGPRNSISWEGPGGPVMLKNGPVGPIFVLFFHFVVFSLCCFLYTLWTLLDVCDTFSRATKAWSPNS